MFQDHYMVKPPDQNLSSSSDQIKPTNLLLQTLQNSTIELTPSPASTMQMQKKPQLPTTETPTSCSNGAVATAVGAAPGTAVAASGSPSTPAPPLRCPRCDSPNTKFCYYNNYSLSQPRHFCKNCRRYWTKGGALRNVPVGGGCRKNKSRGKQRIFGMEPGASSAASGLLDDSVLARLTNSAVNFNGAASTSNGAASTDNILNLAFSRFQEAMRQKHAMENPHKGSSVSSPLFGSDLMAGLSSMIHQSSSPSPKSSCSCSGCTRAGSSYCNNSLNGYLLNAGLIQNPNPNLNSVKLDQAAMTTQGFNEENCNSADQQHQQLNSFLINSTAGNSNAGGMQINPDHHRHQLNAASATATLASIEEQLSHFSQVADNNSPSDNIVNTQDQQQQQSLQFQLLNDHHLHSQSANAVDQYTETDHHHHHHQMNDSTTDQQIHDQISSQMQQRAISNGAGGLSLITSGNVYMNWQPLMSDVFNLEGDQNRLINPASTWATARSWQENIHGASLAAASATTATAGAGMALY